MNVASVFNSSQTSLISNRLFQTIPASITITIAAVPVAALAILALAFLFFRDKGNFSLTTDKGAAAPTILEEEKPDEKTVQTTKITTAEITADADVPVITAVKIDEPETITDEDLDLIEMINTKEVNIGNRETAASPIPLQLFLSLAKTRGKEFKIFDVNYAWDLTEEKLGEVVALCPNLTHVVQAANLDSEGIACLSQLSHLEMLDLRRCKVTDAHLTKVALIPHLKTLAISGENDNQTLVTDSGLAEIAKLTSLCELSLEHFASFSEKGFQCLEALTNLRRLYLHRLVDPIDAALKHVSKLNLQALSLVGAKICSDDLFHITLDEVAKLTSLQELCLDHCHQLTNNALAKLSQLKLKKLSLAHCKQLTDDGLAHLHGQLELEELDLAGDGKLTDKALVTISSFTKLRRLSLRGCSKITFEGLELIASKLNALEYLDLVDCPLPLVTKTEKIFLAKHCTIARTGTAFTKS